jgi:hypothetical protein
VPGGGARQGDGKEDKEQDRAGGELLIIVDGSMINGVLISSRRRDGMDASALHCRSSGATARS